MDNFYSAILNNLQTNLSIISKTQSKLTFKLFSDINKADRKHTDGNQGSDCIPI